MRFSGFDDGQELQVKSKCCVVESKRGTLSSHGTAKTSNTGGRTLFSVKRRNTKEEKKEKKSFFTVYGTL